MKTYEVSPSLEAAAQQELTRADRLGALKAALVVDAARPTIADMDGHAVANCTGVDSFRYALELTLRLNARRRQRCTT